MEARGLGSAIARFFRGCRDHPRATFLACWFAAGMTILLFSAARHKHYAIPMLPPITLAAAVGFREWLASARRQPRDSRQWAWVAAIVLLLIGVDVVGAALLHAIPAKMEIAITIGVIICGVGAALLLHLARRAVGAGVACFGTALAAGLLYQFLLLPPFDDYKASADLARRANAIVPAGQTIYIVGLGETQIAFYLDRPLKRIDRVVPRLGSIKFRPSGELETLIANSSLQEFYILCTDYTESLLADSGKTQRLDLLDRQRRAGKERLVLVRLTK